MEGTKFRRADLGTSFRRKDCSEGDQYKAIARPGPPWQPRILGAAKRK